MEDARPSVETYSPRKEEQRGEKQGVEMEKISSNNARKYAELFCKALSVIIVIISCCNHIYRISSYGKLSQPKKK